MFRFKKRLDALEQAECSGPRFPEMTPALMLCLPTHDTDLLFAIWSYTIPNQGFATAMAHAGEEYHGIRHCAATVL
jgi:hypothetical protein